MYGNHVIVFHKAGVKRCVPCQLLEIIENANIFYAS